MKNVLITGGAGFIGVNLTKALLLKGYKITILDNLLSQVHGVDALNNSSLFLSIKDDVNFFYGSITDRQLLLNALKNIDIVVHLAAETGTGQSMYEIERYTNVNVQGTSVLLNLLANNRFNVRKIVVASSRAIYGEGKYFSKKNGIVYPTTRTNEAMRSGYFEVEYKGERDLICMPTDEESKIHPTSVYGITKQVQEQLIMTVCPTIGIVPVALRYQNVYGPGQSLSNPYTGILSIFSTRINNKSSINIFEDGKESRDFVFINDVINATVRAIENDNANGQIFNVGSGVPTTVETVVKTLMNCFQINVPYTISGNYRLGDIRHNFADITKIREYLDYEPEYSFDKGVSEFVAWARKQNNFVDLYEKSLEEMKQKNMFQS